MNKKYLMISFEDPKIKKISEILGNNTCKKILDFLSEKESTKTDISKELKIPLNTVEYNVNKLNESGLIEKSKNYFWSTKGKRISVYKISNKSIVISPKNSNKIGNIFGLVAISGITALLIKTLTQPTQPEEVSYVAKGLIENTSDFSQELLAGTTLSAPSAISLILTQPWFWFLVGAIGVGIIFLIINWKKI